MKNSEKNLVKKEKSERFNWRILGENFVFENNGHFYKMPAFFGKNVIYKNTDSYDQIQKSFKLVKKYFGPLSVIPPTEIECDNESCDYIIKQEKIAGRKLTKKDLEQNPKLEAKFKRLVIANEIMRSNEGYFLDLVGSEIVTHPATIHNVFTNGEDLFIFDFGLLKKKASTKFYSAFSSFATKIQLFFIKIFYK